MTTTPPARHRSPAPEHRDGHVLYPCGCWWNKRLKVYSRTCSDTDGRTATPPHGEPRVSPVSVETLIGLLIHRRKK